MAKSSGRVQWHQIFAAIMVELFRPLGIEIYTEFNLSPSPPIGDVLILRSGGKGWTKEQLKWLPDGIRQCLVRHILLEFKYTESLNLLILLQAIMSYVLYCRSNQLTNKDVAFFVILSRQPRPDVLQHFGYQPAGITGLYRSNQPTLEDISLISLNELSPTHYNAFIKCFASQQKQKKVAFEQIRQTPFGEIPQELQWLLTGLLNRILADGGDLMENDVITVEKVRQMGQLLSEAWLNSLPPQKRLAGLSPAELLTVIPRSDLLASLPPAERVAGLAPAELLTVIPRSDLLASLPPAERMAGLAPAERMAGLPPAERIAGLPPAERMAGLSRAEIEAYLAQLTAPTNPPYAE